VSQHRHHKHCCHEGSHQKIVYRSGGDRIVVFGFFNLNVFCVLGLPRTEERRKAFLNKGELASAWVTAWPEPELRLENTLFAEVVATYFGLPSPTAERQQLPF
jgi:hypothetical protein